MAGALLRSGSVKHFKPLGATGNPVYRAASQLRAAIRRHLGAEMADYFAIPQQDDKGDTIDWYAPLEGSVVPWTAATPEERGEAKTRLLAAQQELRQKSRALQDGESSEQQVFGKLLELATRIPGEDHVYLVDGRPVMTFWGFDERDAPDYQDILATLDVGNGVSATADGTARVGDGDGAAPAETAVTRTGRARWWSWPLLPLLLAFLLLGGLLFGLRSCMPGWVPGAGLIAPAPTEEPVSVSPDEPQKERDDGHRTASGHADDIDQETQQADGVTVVDEVSRRGVVEHSGKESGAFDDTGEDVDSTRSAVDSERDGAKDAETGGSRPGADASAAPPKPDKERQADTPDEPTKDGQPAGEPDEPAGKQDTAAQDKVPDQDRQQTPAGAGPAAQDGRAGAPLIIPKDAAKKGSTDFMNGNWQSVTGLQDANGNPVKLEYAFKDGQGTAKLRHSAGGTEQECTAAVRPSFKGSTLMIDQTDDIRCPDGTRFQRSAVECTTNAQGRAECKGRNQDGSAYQVRINKQ